MGIKLSAIRRIGDAMEAWLPWPGLPEVSFLVERATADDDRALFGLDKGEKPRDISEEEWRDWHLARVKDWRGIDADDGQPAPFDRAELVTPWKENAAFRNGLIGGCRELASFLRGIEPAPPVALRTVETRVARRGR